MILDRITAQDIRTKYGRKFTRMDVLQRNADLTHGAEHDRGPGKEKLWIQSKITEWSRNIIQNHRKSIVLSVNWILQMVMRLYSNPVEMVIMGKC